jgi:hypothetical protein
MEQKHFPHLSSRIYILWIVGNDGRIFSRNSKLKIYIEAQKTSNSQDNLGNLEQIE